MKNWLAPHKLYRLNYLMDLLITLVARDLKLRYRRSVMGVAWSLLNPLAQLLVLSFVFRTILPLRIPNYTVFLFVGLLPWTWFQISLFQATDSIVGNRELIRRPGFPVSVLPVITVTSNLIHLVLAFPVLVLFMLFSGINLTSAVFVLPILVILQFALILSLAYPLATLHVTFRDTQYLLGVFLLVGFYLTPVFYDVSAIPERYQLIYRLNPMVDLVDAYRTVLIHGQLPNASSLWLMGLLIVLLLVFGHIFFMRASYQFAEEL